MHDYPIQPVPFTQAELHDSFWSPRIQVNRNVTIPFNFQKCEDTGRVDNFLKAAKKMQGSHTGLVFNDSDVFKVMEGAAYSLRLYPDQDLEAYMDNLIALIADAQEEDGYLYTARTVDPKTVKADREGLERWSNLKFNHELYNLGHMYEAAVAHHLATGKRNFLDIAIKSANLVDSVFGVNKKRDVPGHQEIEVGLVKLYRVTGEKRYLELAKYFLDERGHYHGRTESKLFDIPGYAQDHLPVTQQKEAVGHAVRAVYMYAGMADVAALTGNQDYIKALDALWENEVSKKIYLTGGIGSRHHGESFGDDYELPNATAYNETCAAIGNIFWNQRMFLLHGDAKYHDVIERTLFNGFLSGVALTGDKYFYVNPLAFDGKTNFNRDDSCVRNPWFECSCCPPNIARLLSSLSGYIYASKDDKVYVNQFISSRTSLKLSGKKIELEQQSNYPWDGNIKLTIHTPSDFTLAIRIPGWVQNKPLPSDLYTYLGQNQETPTISVNGGAVATQVERGYLMIKHHWQKGDVVELELPMPVRRVLIHEAVKENRGRVAVERGPVVYCAEAVDHGGQALDLSLRDEEVLEASHEESFLGGATLIKGKNLTLLPYHLWAHRGVGEMAVWLKRG